MFSASLAVLLMAVASGERQDRALQQGRTHGESSVDSEHQINKGHQIVGKPLANRKHLVNEEHLAENLFVSSVRRDTMQ